MSRPQTGFHVRLRPAALAEVRQTYPTVGEKQLWRTEIVNGGYGRDALHLVEVASYTAAPSAMRIVVWRGQVVGEPRCEYCGMEGHTKTTGTAANCATRAAEVAEQRQAQSVRMTAHWARIKAEAVLMQESSPGGYPPAPTYDDPPEAT